MEPINIVSYGGGVNSTAMIILMLDKGININEVIFCDTGNEMPETYNFLPIFKEWLTTNNLKLTIIKSHLGDLKSYYMSKNIIPLKMFRQCTDKFKVRPIHKYLKKYKGNHINMFLGIDAGEKHRAKKSEKKNLTTHYPLIEYDINRVGCKKIINNVGLPVPIKSGCYFCPFQKKTEWIKLLKNSPDLYNESIEFEENCKRFPEFHLGQVPLRKLRDIEKSQTRLSKFLENDLSVTKCVYCHS